MFDVNAIGSSVSATTLRDYVNQAFDKRSDSGLAVADDSVEISDIAELLSKLSELPNDRARKIVDIRKAIQDGTYESPLKLDVAAERFLRDLSTSDDK
jgi:anti-sigma28 factor (negative regulator of flagellin synthesis)